MFLLLSFFYMKDCNSFNLPGTDPTASCSSSDGASTNESRMTDPPCLSSILLSNPDLIQSETDAATTSALEVRNQSFVQEKMFLCLPQKHRSNNLRNIVCSKLNLFSGDGRPFSSSELRHWRPLLANIRRRAAASGSGCCVLGQDPSCCDHPECPHS